MTNPFSPEATAGAIKKLPDLPPEQGGFGGVVTSDGDAGVQGAINKDIGKPGGWFVLAEGSWMRRAGGAVSGWIGWRKP